MVKERDLTQTRVPPVNTPFRRIQNALPVPESLRVPERVFRYEFLAMRVQCFWEFAHPAQAEAHLRSWMPTAKRTCLRPLKIFVLLLEDRLDGLLAWTGLRLSNGALQGMNNKIKIRVYQEFPQNFRHRVVNPFVPSALTFDGSGQRGMRLNRQRESPCTELKLCRCARAESGKSSFWRIFNRLPSLPRFGPTAA